MRVCTVGNIGYPQLRKHTIGNTRLLYHVRRVEVKHAPYAVRHDDERVAF